MNKMVWFGADSIGIAERKGVELREKIDAFRDLSTSLALNDLQPTTIQR